MTGIRFLDELSAPRRSTILASQLQSTQRRASLQTAETTMADYVVAMAIDVPQLELYSHVAADLQRWIEHSKEIYGQVEEEAAKVTPMLFREYSMADEQTQAELLVSSPPLLGLVRKLTSFSQQQLKLIKANNHATARSQWYDWRLQWVEQLHDIANQGFAELEQVRSATVVCVVAQSDHRKGRQYVGDHNSASTEPFAIAAGRACPGHQGVRTGTECRCPNRKLRPGVPERAKGYFGRTRVKILIEADEQLADVIDQCCTGRVSR
jgi:Spc7 kinetochore protein